MKNWTLKLPSKSTTLSIFYSFFFAGALLADEFVTLDELFDEDLEEVAPSFQDPYEPVNRAIFKFNDYVYLNLLDPLVTGYEYVTPDPVKKRMTNFFENLNFPIRFASNLLQGKFEGALLESGAFLLNSTVGLAGLNRASDYHPEMKALPKEDMGQVLGVWGMEHGPYIVLPILGPSSFREALGRVGDLTVDPLRYPFTMVDDFAWRLGHDTAGTFVKSSALVNGYRKMKGSALDPYVAMRNGYLQYRDAAVRE